MNKVLLVLLFSCSFLTAARSQEIKRLVPWSNAPMQTEMGMAAQDLKTILPTISPLLGIFDNGDSDESEVVKNGMYAPDPDGIDYSEATVYGIGGGRVTQFYWSSKKMASVADVEKIRKKFSEMHGKPKVGYKARLTREGIAKIVTEVYSVNGSNLVVSLSSALGSTEVAVIDTSDPKINLKELYFSYEKQKARLQNEMIRLTGKKPEEENSSECSDVLAALIAEPSNGQNTSSRRPNNDLRENNSDDLQKQQSAPHLSEEIQSQEEITESIEKSRLPQAIAGAVLVGILLLLFRRCKSKAAS